MRASVRVADSSGLWSPNRTERRSRHSWPPILQSSVVQYPRHSGAGHLHGWLQWLYASYSSINPIRHNVKAAAHDDGILQQPSRSDALSVPHGMLVSPRVKPIMHKAACPNTDRNVLQELAGPMEKGNLKGLLFSQHFALHGSGVARTRQLHEEPPSSGYSETSKSQMVHVHSAVISM